MKKIMLLVFLSLFLVASEKTIVIEVKGMTCPLCTTAVKKSLKKIKGVKKAKVKLNTKKATVLYDDKIVTKKELLNAIKRVGYKGTIKNIVTKSGNN